ncbi:MAG: prepilin-type N-terminal cleavage/methylation domain-containing protein [Candidatus Colwellbacteria bacterium]|nr:prepilin-type N-terminal cleavage/methylation domain-containing protein [Candidatus Colwellbacteria bacterium]
MRVDQREQNESQWKRPLRASRRLAEGFTLMELLVYVSILAISGLALTMLLAVVGKIANREASSFEVARQVQFVTQRIQNLIQNASLVDAAYEGDAEGIPCATYCSVRLRTATASTDPTILASSPSGVYLREGSGGSVPLTSDGVQVNSLRFTLYPNPGGRVIVAVDLSLSATTGREPRETRAARFAVGHVSAASFDSDLLPDAGNARNIGQTSLQWRNLAIAGDAIIGGKIGIGVADPIQRVEIDGGIRLNTSGAKPTCAATTRGLFWVTQNGAGVQDKVEVCAKNASDVYAWRTIY